MKKEYHHSDVLLIYNILDKLEFVMNHDLRVITRTSLLLAGFSFIPINIFDVFLFHLRNYIYLCSQSLGRNPDEQALVIISRLAKKPRKLIGIRHE